MKPQFFPQGQGQGQDVTAYLTPTEQIKKDVIELAKQATEHYSKAYDDEREKWAFYVKTRILALRLKGFMNIPMRIWLRDQLLELDKKIEEIETNPNLSNDNKKINSVNTRYNYALPIYDLCIELLHNCPIVETISDSVIELDLENIEKRIRLSEDGNAGKEGKVKPLRKEKEEATTVFSIKQVEMLEGENGE